MLEAANSGFSTATDLADYLVIKGVPFRDAHEVVGKAVAYGISENRDLAGMTLDELKMFSSDISDDVFDILTLEGSVESRNHIGGTAPDQVKSAAERALSKIEAR
jgi:argininosuccinate lyase